MAGYTGGGAAAPYKPNRSKPKKPPRPVKPLRPDPAPTPNQAQRTAGRLKALGTTPKGVDASDGFSKKENKIVLLSRRAQKAGKIGQRSYKRYRQNQRKA